MEIKKTITSIFMVPTIRAPKDALKNNGFINAYLKDSLKEDEYKNCIYLLFKPENLDKFREFLDNEYERTKHIIEDYDYEKGYVVVVYKLEDKYENDFNLIKLGKYSQTSKLFQKEFPEKISIIRNGFQKQEISLQYRIFNKTQDLIDFWEEKLNVVFDEKQEVWEGFEEQKEILNINKILQYE